MIDAAESLLFAASTAGELGRFQLEAAIQSAHVFRRRLGVKNWDHIAHLYEGLVRLFPTVGSYVGRAAAVMEAYGSAQALELMEQIETDAINEYQPYWALLGEIRYRMRDMKNAKKSFQRAAGLASDNATREFLLKKMADCNVNLTWPL